MEIFDGKFDGIFKPSTGLRHLGHEMFRSDGISDGRDWQVGFVHSPAAACDLKIKIVPAIKFKFPRMHPVARNRSCDGLGGQSNEINRLETSACATCAIRDSALGEVAGTFLVKAGQSLDTYQK